METTNFLASFLIGAGELSFILIPIGFLILLIIALIDILRSQFKGNDKIVWLLVVLLIPMLGPILYFIIGVNQKIRF